MPDNGASVDPAERLENLKRMWVAGDLSLEEARMLDDFWRRRLCNLPAASGSTAPPKPPQ